jgi:hypothetical protein
MIDSHNAWHAAQQERWTREAEARKATKARAPVRQ